MHAFLHVSVAVSLNKIRTTISGSSSTTASTSLILACVATATTSRALPPLPPLHACAMMVAQVPLCAEKQLQKACLLARYLPEIMKLMGGSKKVLNATATCL
jgi:hypothetical protein